MFLNLLEGTEKENFLALAYFVANYNKDFAKEQQALISQYRKELGVAEDDNIRVNKDITEILVSFRNSSNNVKNAVFVEIMALIFSDGDYDSKEKEVAVHIMEMLGITEEKYEAIIKWIQDIRELYAKGNELINS